MAFDVISMAFKTHIFNYRTVQRLNIHVVMGRDNMACIAKHVAILMWCCHGCHGNKLSILLVSPSPAGQEDLFSDFYCTCIGDI